jgi:hypothetical protein
MKVDLDELDAMHAFIAKVNETPLESSEFHRSGTPFHVDPEAVAYWKFIGLGNARFHNFLRDDGTMNVIVDDEDESE